MGCTATKAPDPNAQNNVYTTKHENGPTTRAKTPNKVHPGKHSGENGKLPNVNDENTKNNVLNKKSLKGDLTMYSEAKLHRERTMKKRLRRRELLAAEMSDKVMEEKEWLSLTSSRSRATSRIGSPKHPRSGVSGVSVLTTSDLPLTVAPSRDQRALPKDQSESTEKETGQSHYTGMVNGMDNNQSETMIHDMSSKDTLKSQEDNNNGKDQDKSPNGNHVAKEHVKDIGENSNCGGVSSVTDDSLKSLSTNEAAKDTIVVENGSKPSTSGMPPVSENK